MKQIGIILCVTFTIFNSMCDADLSRFNNIEQNVGEKEKRRMTFNERSAKQNQLETQIKTLTTTVLELKSEIVGLKSELTKLQDTCSSATVTSTDTTNSNDSNTKGTTTEPLTSPPTFLRSCDEGWSNFDDHCYLIVKKGKSRDVASSFCELKNSYLIEINTDPEREFINTTLLRDYADYGFWTGATDRDTPENFVYQHSKEVVPEKYWHDGEPNNYTGNQHCVSMDLRNGDVKFWDITCSWWFWAVCEKP